MDSNLKSRACKARARLNFHTTAVKPFPPDIREVGFYGMNQLLAAYIALLYRTVYCAVYHSRQHHSVKTRGRIFQQVTVSHQQLYKTQLYQSKETTDPAFRIQRSCATLYRFDFQRRLS